MTDFMAPSDIRALFSRAMSAMYRLEVPHYGTLLELVADINGQVLARDETLKTQMAESQSLDRLSEERHGAIRLGTAAELSMMRRLFKVMGMEPVSYYDLSVAGIPVHSTAFRPVEMSDLQANPFRVFTSLLRLELIEDATLRAEAEAILAKRQIFTPKALELIATAEINGGLNAQESEVFVAAALETFRWHAHATVDAATYQRLHDAHRLIADVVSFKGPHINHLTPRTLDIDAAQAEMPKRGIAAKDVVEGPPRRACPILLRQTSFKALEEAIQFPQDGGYVSGRHTARFGEIEERGVALTPKGRALYDRLLNDARDGTDGSYETRLQAAFAALPDDARALHDQGLAFYTYRPLGEKPKAPLQLTALLDAGLIALDPIIYEDFLPVSAAGIFQSNLGAGAGAHYSAASNRADFEAAMGAGVHNEFALYQRQVDASLKAVIAAGYLKP